MITLRFSKTDQEGAGRLIGIPYHRGPETCPVRSLDQWLKEGKITEGYVFRAVKKGGKGAPVGLANKSVALIVKKTIPATGFDPDPLPSTPIITAMQTKGD